MPMCAMGLPSGPIENGTTYIVRPRMQPSNSPFSVRRISAGATQLLVGPASSLAGAADERAVLHARDVGRVRAREIAAGTLRFVQLLERARTRPSRRTARDIRRRCRRTTRCGRVASARRFHAPSPGDADGGRRPAHRRMRRVWRRIRSDSSRGESGKRETALRRLSSRRGGGRQFYRRPCARRTGRAALPICVTRRRADAPRRRQRFRLARRDTNAARARTRAASPAAAPRAA